MVYFEAIKKTKHYIKEHEDDVPWSEVIDVIIKSSKNMRKKRGKIEIKNRNYYILGKIEKKTLFIINAKRRLK